VRYGHSNILKILQCGAVCEQGFRTQRSMRTIILVGSTTLDRKRIYANSSSYPKPKAQLCFRTDEVTSFFNQV